MPMEGLWPLMVAFADRHLSSEKTWLIEIPEIKVHQSNVCLLKFVFLPTVKYLIGYHIPVYSSPRPSIDNCLNWPWTHIVQWGSKLYSRFSAAKEQVFVHQLGKFSSRNKVINVRLLRNQMSWNCCINTYTSFRMTQIRIEVLRFLLMFYMS